MEIRRVHETCRTLDIRKGYTVKDIVELASISINKLHMLPQDHQHRTVQILSKLFVDTYGHRCFNKISVDEIQSVFECIMLERAQWEIGHRDESRSESSNSGQHEGSKGHSDSNNLNLSRSQREAELENDNASVNVNGGQAYSQHANNVNIVFMIVHRHKSGVSMELWKGVKVRNKSLSILVAELF